jgi:hypothetical protein
VNEQWYNTDKDLKVACPFTTAQLLGSLLCLFTLKPDEHTPKPTVSKYAPIQCDRKWKSSYPLYGIQFFIEFTRGFVQATRLQFVPQIALNIQKRWMEVTLICV